jgi:hypothetical protein
MRLGKFNARLEPNGILWIPRRSILAEQYFDKLYHKLDHTHWLTVDKPIELCSNLKQKYSGRLGIIVGKGASLKAIGSIKIPTDSVIIAINEAIDYMTMVDKNLYLIQQDSKPQCNPHPATGVLLHTDVGTLYPKCTNRCIFNHVSLGFEKKPLTVFVAIQILKFMGCNTIAFISFDYATDGVSDYPEQMPDYRQGIQVWKDLKSRIVKAVSPLTYSFITPLDPETQISDRVQL